MSELAQAYCRAIRGSTGMSAAWDVTRRINVGDYGRQEGEVFVPLGEFALTSAIHSAHLDKPCFKTAVDGAKVVAGTSLAAKFSDEIGSNAEASLRLKFNKKHGVYFASAIQAVHKATDTEKIIEEMLRRQRDGRWDMKNRVVVRVLEANSTCILVSKGGGVELAAVGGAKVGALDATLSGADLSFVAGLAGAMAIEERSQAQLTPLFGTVALRKRWGGEVEFDVSQASTVSEAHVDYIECDDEYVAELRLGQHIHGA